MYNWLYNSSNILIHIGIHWYALVCIGGRQYKPWRRGCSKRPVVTVVHRLQTGRNNDKDSPSHSLHAIIAIAASYSFVLLNVFLGLGPKLVYWSGEIMFSIMAPNRQRCDELIMRAIIKNMISPDYVLCYKPDPWEFSGKQWKFGIFRERAGPFWSFWRPLWGFRNFQKTFKYLDLFLEFLKTSRFWKITSYNFQSRRPIMALGGVWSPKTDF